MLDRGPGIHICAHFGDDGVGSKSIDAVAGSQVHTQDAARAVFWALRDHVAEGLVVGRGQVWYDELRS